MVATALIWGGRLAWAGLSRFGPMALRAGQSALGFAARRPISTLAIDQVTTGGALRRGVGSAMGFGGGGEDGNGPGAESGGLNWGNMAMLGGGVLALKMFGGNGMAMAGAALGPLMMAENGFPRAMSSIQGMMEGITAGTQTGDWSQFNQSARGLGSIYGEALGIQGLQTGADGPTPGQNGTPHVEWNGNQLVVPGQEAAGPGADAAAPAGLPVGDLAAGALPEGPAAGADALHAEGAAAVAASEVSAGPPTDMPAVVNDGLPRPT